MSFQFEDRAELGKRLRGSPAVRIGQKSLGLRCGQHARIGANEPHVLVGQHKLSSHDFTAGSKRPCVCDFSPGQIHHQHSDVGREVGPIAFNCDGIDGFVACDLRDSEIGEVLCAPTVPKINAAVRVSDDPLLPCFVVREGGGVDLRKAGTFGVANDFKCGRVDGEQSEIGAGHDAIAREHDLFHLLVRDVAGPFAHGVLRMQWVSPKAKQQTHPRTQPSRRLTC